MNGKERRAEILNILKTSDKPVPGTELAEILEVSRQVIVQDMALLRTGGEEILSTHKGYVLNGSHQVSRVFKVYHTKEQVEEEMNLFVDFGGKIDDVFVYHRVHGVIKVSMNIRSRRDVQKYMENIATGKSTQLMNLTSNYHYHTITAETEEVLDSIQEELKNRGFLAKLQDWEPVDFWKG